jgi:quinol-cytochrome oxidoreductase complex cytochrome b subunit
MTDQNIRSNEEPDSIPFYPDHVRTELRVIIGLVAIVVVVAIIGLLAPVGLGDPADPMDTPLHVKPEWYFLWLYQILKVVPKTVGVLIPLVIVGLMLFWPFLDRRPDRTYRSQRVRLAAAVIVLLIIFALTLWGELS